MECYILVRNEYIVINLMSKHASKYIVFILNKITTRPLPQ